MTHESLGGFDPGAYKASETPRHARRLWIRNSVIVTLAFLLLAVGFGAGVSTGASAQQNLSQARGQLSALRGKLSTVSAELSSAQVAVQSARTQANNADAAARAKYASQEAALAAKERTVAQADQAVKALMGRLQSSAISADGVYVVGRDLRAGTWHTPGDGGQNGQACYYATLGSTNTSDISDNNNFDGPETVDLSGAYAFQISGPCTWYRTGS